MGDFRPRQRSQFSRVVASFRGMDRMRVLVVLAECVGCLLLMYLATVLHLPTALRWCLLLLLLAMVGGLAYGLLSDNRDARRERKGKRWRPPVKQIEARGWTYTKKVSEARFHEIRGTVDEIPFAAWYLVSTPAKRTGPRSWQMEMELPASLPELEVRARGGTRGTATYAGTEIDVADDEISARYQVFAPAASSSEYADRLFSPAVVEALTTDKPFDFDIDHGVIRAYARPVNAEVVLERIEKFGTVMAATIGAIDQKIYRRYGRGRLSESMFRESDSEVASLADEEFELG